MSLKVVLLAVHARVANVPLNFSGRLRTVTRDFGHGQRDFGHGQGDIGHPCIKEYYGLVLCYFLFYFAYNNIVNHII